MITFGVCDDDIEFMESIKSIILKSFYEHSTSNNEAKCIGYHSGQELVANFVKDKIDIIFMDIECGDELGFDIARKISRMNSDVGIVYMSNYNSYVSKAYVCRPLGFIRKEFFKDEIELPMMEIIDYYNQKYQNLTVYDGNDPITIPIHLIEAVQVFKHTLTFYYTEKEMDITSSLAKYEEDLLGMGFVKVSRETLVNMRHVARIDNNVIMTGSGRTFDISRKKVKIVNQEWQQYIARGER